MHIRIYDEDIRREKTFKRNVGFEKFRMLL